MSSELKTHTQRIHKQKIELGLDLVLGTTDQSNSNFTEDLDSFMVVVSFEHIYLCGHGFL